MAHDTQTLIIRPSAWGRDAERLIALAHQAAGLADVRDQVQSGAASLFLIDVEGATVGAFVLRVDHTAAGSEGVIVSGAGHLHGVDLVEACIPRIEQMFVGVCAIRYHTAKPALARKMAAWGYTAAEIVCRKELKNAPIQQA